MARRCDYCNRGPRIAATRSKSNIQTKRWQQVNLQPRTVDGVRYKVCTKCLKTFTKRGLVEIPKPSEVKKLTHAVKAK